MTPNKEDYLKCIYEIGTEEGKISNKEIANRMQVSPPAVTEMIKKLISEDLIIKDKVKGYLLTKTGKINVAELYRKHRLIEVFLVDHLQYTCDLIHQEAEILEHTVSDHFINALDRLLNYPQTCPHVPVMPYYKYSSFLFRPLVSFCCYQYTTSYILYFICFKAT